MLTSDDFGLKSICPGRKGKCNYCHMLETLLYLKKENGNQGSTVAMHACRLCDHILIKVCICENFILAPSRKPPGTTTQIECRLTYKNMGLHYPLKDLYNYMAASPTQCWLMYTIIGLHRPLNVS